jgi:hypothetical protein
MSDDFAVFVSVGGRFATDKLLTTSCRKLSQLVLWFGLSTACPCSGVRPKTCGKQRQTYIKQSEKKRVDAVTELNLIT